MLSKSKASPCILTLILSFVLSDYTINLKRIKLKMGIVHCPLRDATTPYPGRYVQAEKK